MTSYGAHPYEVLQVFVGYQVQRDRLGKTLIEYGVGTTKNGLRGLSRLIPCCDLFLVEGTDRQILAIKIEQTWRCFLEDLPTAVANQLMDRDDSGKSQPTQLAVVVQVGRWDERYFAGHINS